MKEKMKALADKAKRLPEKAKGLIEKTGAFIKTKTGKIWTAAAAVVLLALIGLGCYSGWLYQQTKFHGVTIELGSGLPEVEAFLTEYANPKKARLETAEANIDLTHAGDQTLQFSHGSKVENVVLTIEDTTVPVVTFQDVTVSIRDTLEADDFVAEVKELSDYTIAFAQELEKPESYDGVTVQILVTDAYGNTTSAQCRVNYQWMREAYTLELGGRIGKANLLYHYDKDRELLDQEQITQINQAGVGTYTVTSTCGSAVNECVVTVRDTTGPELKLQDVTVFLGEAAKLEDFVVSTADISGDVITRLAEELPLEEAGIYTVVVEAEDIYGNVSSAEAELRVIVDTVPPEFTGMDDLYVEKYGNPAYYYDVTAVDARDGEVEFTVDASRVDTTRAGTYYAVYSAKDKEGNEGTYRRKVVVNHDSADTAALVSSIAAGLSSDPETIRNYVRDYIWYSHYWGGDDPVWNGFKGQEGNCYVHALCFQALLREKGYETQLIWVTDQSHYWNLVKINGVWKHMDSTPGTLHSRYSIMNDATRYETLSGRDWDRSAWPAVE